MSIFDVLTMIGGLCLFLFGMNIMGEALERSAGSSLRSLLGKFTSTKMAGFLLKAIGDMERIGDHCANVANSVIDLAHHNRNIHENNHLLKQENPDFAAQFAAYQAKYRL